MKIIDKSNMRKTILEFPKQFQKGLEVAKNVKIEGAFDALTICGMGGSALPADILEIWLNAYKIALPLYIHRNYGLPNQVDKKHLIICISYSGNTEETLNCFEEARKNGFKIITIASGGKLTELSKKHGIPSVMIPAGFQPRMALGFQYAALMQVLVNCGLVEDGLDNISALEELLKPQSLEAYGKKLAQRLRNKIPVVYASYGLRSLARIWKIKFNENSKIPAFNNYFPELNHNEMMGYANAGNNFQVIVLRDPTDHPRILKRIKLMASLIKKRGVSIDIIDIKGKDILYKIFSSILLGDWISYYLALKRGIDPTPVELNEEFKKRLAR